MRQGLAISIPDPGLELARRPRTYDTNTLAARHRDERRLELCEAMLDIVAAIFNVSGRELRRPGRSNESVTRVRQIAMYATHVALGVSMADIARCFGRDRTTVLHACHAIEDMRDDAEFDRIVAMIERLALVAFRDWELVRDAG